MTGSMSESAVLKELHEKDVQMARMDEKIKNIQGSMEEVKNSQRNIYKKLDTIQWKLAGIVAIVSTVIQFYFNYVKN